MRLSLTRAYRALADRVVSSTAKQAPASCSSKAGASVRANRGTPAFFEPLEERTLMSTTYYISNAGSDSNSGTSVNSPWKTPAKVSSTHLNPGDQALFEGGETFSGGLNLYSDGGSASDPIVIGSYGSGRATIASGTSVGLWALGTSGITIENLNFVGTHGSETSQDGIRLENYNTNAVRSGYLVTNCSITGYAENGVDFGGDTSSEGVNDLTLSNDTIYGNTMNGIESWANGAENNTNILITNCQVYGNTGNGTANTNGSGIMLQGLDGATVEYNSVYDNGAKGNGGVGIWCYDSNDVMFQYNQSYDNHTEGGDDGDGFDFDSNTSNSIMQYNYAANNDGGGFELDNWENDNTETGDIVRYNVAQNNAKKNNYSGIDIWGKVINAQVYNNTVYASQATSGQTSDIRISNNSITYLFPSNDYIANNLFVSTGDTPLVDFYSAALTGASNIKFDGNAYYSYSGTPYFVWGSWYGSLSSWQSATGQEKLNGTNTGIYANPQLASAGNAAVPASSDNPTTINAYHLQSSTPILNSGVVLNSLFSVASPLTGSTSKTIPGIDQSLSSSATSGSGSASSGSGSSSSNSSSGSTTTTTPKGTFSSTSLAGWDIGSPNAGSNSESGSTDIVTGGGAGIAKGSDSFRYAWTTMTNNGEMSAQVTSMSNSSSIAEAGVMVRTSTAANAPEVSMLTNPGGKTASLVWRSVAGGVTDTYSIADNGDQYVKLVRNGLYYSGYISANGSTWTLVGTIYLDTGTTVDIGLATTASAMGSTETATYKNVTLTGM